MKIIKRKTMRISKDLLKEMLKDIHSDTWDYWAQHCPKIYFKFNDLLP